MKFASLALLAGLVSAKPAASTEADILHRPQWGYNSNIVGDFKCHVTWNNGPTKGRTHKASITQEPNGLFHFELKGHYKRELHELGPRAFEMQYYDDIYQPIIAAHANGLEFTYLNIR